MAKKTNIIRHMVLELGCPVFVIAKALNVSEADVLKFISGENPAPPDTDSKVRKLLLNLLQMKISKENYRI